MNIISAQNVDLLTPFPPAETERIWGWKHCYRSLPEDDDTPKEKSEFTALMAELLPFAFSAGVVDKGQITSAKHEAPLVGLLAFIPTGKRDGVLHFAAGRKAFKMGLVEEALSVFLPALLDSAPDLLRISVLLDEANTPAKGLVKRLGFRFEGVTQSAILMAGVPRSRVQFGLTRERGLIPPVDYLPVPLVADPVTPVEEVVEDGS